MLFPFTAGAEVEVTRSRLCIRFLLPFSLSLLRISFWFRSHCQWTHRCHHRYLGHQYSLRMPLSSSRYAIVSVCRQILISLPSSGSFVFFYTFRHGFQDRWIVMRRASSIVYLFGKRFRRMMKISSIQRIHEIANFKNHILGMAKEKSTYVRYAVRYKRADAKKALKDLLDGKPSYNICQDDENHQHSKNSGRSKPQKSHSMKGKRSKYWSKKNCCSDEDEQSSATFTANFGRWRSFTWSFNTWESSNCQNNTNGFQWKDDTKSDKHRGRIWSESDLEEEDNDIDLHSDRIALGLPASGHLCLDDVKRAFRESALKWHPDKHQGVAQVVAAEKFKLCVDAYKKLCNALRPP